MHVNQRCDAGLATNYRPVSLASCCSKLFERLVHVRSGPLISSQLDVCQGGFRWGADVLVSSLVDVWSSRRSTLTFDACADIQKAFDTSWVAGTLVRLHDLGVRGQMWRLMCHFLHGGSSLSVPWQDSGIAQGRVRSPLIFNLLVDTLASDVHRLAPGVRLPSHHRFSDQLLADDLVVVADCEHDLQVS